MLLGFAQLSTASSILSTAAGPSYLTTILDRIFHFAFLRAGRTATSPLHPPCSPVLASALTNPLCHTGWALPLPHSITLHSFNIEIFIFVLFDRRVVPSPDHLVAATTCASNRAYGRFLCCINRHPRSSTNQPTCPFFLPSSRHSASHWPPTTTRHLPVMIGRHTTPQTPSAVDTLYSISRIAQSLRPLLLVSSWWCG
jgi:hypothetical protein